MISICFFKIVHPRRVRFSSLFRLGLVFFAVLLVLRLDPKPPIASGIAFQELDEEVDSTNRIPALIQDLGSESYPVRFAAQEALTDIGEPALGPLLTVAEDLRAAKDYEIQISAQAIVQKIRGRLGKTFADSFRAGEKILPGWDSFSKRYGDSKEHVELYATMYESKSTELNRFAEKKINATMVTALVASSGGKLGTDAVGGLATSMFLATEMLTSPIGDEPYGEAYLRNLMPTFYRSNVVSAIKGSSSKQTLLQMLDGMIKAIPDRQQFRSPRLRLYGIYQEASFLGSMIEVAHDREQAVSARVEMIGSMVGIEDSEAKQAIIESLVALFDDRSSVGRFLILEEPKKAAEAEPADSELKIPTGTLQWTPENAQRPNRNERMVDVEVRDVALAGAIALSGLSQEKFGFPAEALVKKGNDAKPKLDPRFAGFSDSAQRNAAFEKWKLLGQKND